MVTYHPSNSIFKTSGNGQDIGGGKLIVDQGIAVVATSGLGVNGTGRNVVTCNGVLAGDVGAYFDGTGSILTISNTGTVTGHNTGALMSGGDGALITNSGSIFGGNIGVQLFGGVQLLNNGSIFSGEFRANPSAIFLGGNDGASTITNNGQITAKSAGTFAILSAETTVSTTVINNGVIKGIVKLGGGADTYDGIKGTISRGTIDGGGGSDKLTGGTGVEIMKGGSGADTFFFKTKPDATNVDHITDFTRGQDHIGLSQALFKLDPGQTIATAFKDITNNKSDADDHILYNHDKGALYYDPDGMGGAAPVAFAILDNKPATLAASDFLLV